LVARGLTSRLTRVVKEVESQIELPLEEKANPWGARIMCLFVLMLAGVTAMVARDYQNVRKLEAFSENTAVGDYKLVNLDAFPANEAPRVMINETPALIIASPRISVRDSRMRRVEKDEATGISIYTTDASNLKGQRLKGASDGPLNFVKVKSGEYVQARVGK